MNKGNEKFHVYNESPIFQDVSLLSVEKTTTGRVVILHNDGSVSTLMKFEGINNSSFSEEDYEFILTKMSNVFEQMHDPSLSFQFIMMRETADPQVQVDHLPTYLKPRAEFRKVLAENQKLFENNFYFAVYSRSEDGNKGEGIIKKALRLYRRYIKKEQETDAKRSEYYDDAFQGIKMRTKSVLNATDKLRSLLNDIGGVSKELSTEQEVYNIIQKFIRPNKHRIGPLKDKNQPELGREGLIEIDRKKGDNPRKALFSGVRVENYKDYFYLDNYYHKVFQLDRCPKTVLYGHTIDAIESVPFEFIYSVTFRKKPIEEARSSIKGELMNAVAAEGAAQGGLVADYGTQVKRRRVEEEFIRFEEQEGIGIDISANFVLRVKEDYILKQMRELDFTKDEVLLTFDQDLQTRVFTQFGASEWISEPRTDFRVFTKILPGCSDIKQWYLKKQFVTAENIPYFLALYDNQRKVHHNGTNHFIDLRGTQINYDLFDNNLAAWNYSISGQTGSGKSVLVNALLTMQFADTFGDSKKPVICILDVGGDRGSYMKFMKLVDGSQINLSGILKPHIQMLEIKPEISFPTPDKRAALAKYLLKTHKEEFSNAKEGAKKDLENLETAIDAFYNKKLAKTSPSKNSYEYDLETFFKEIFNIKFTAKLKEMFKLETGECEPAPRNMNLILGCLEVILSTNAKNRLDAFDTYDKDEISKLVLMTYRKIGAEEKRLPYLRDLVDIADKTLDKSEPLIRKMIVKLENWTRNGANKMFDQDTNIDVSSDIVLADLKGLEEYPELQMIYTMLISEVFNNKMYFLKDRRKIIVRDEAWSLMSNERARNYFQEDLRTARKNGFATISITQLPTDYLYPDRQAGKAIITNFQVNIFCKFSTESTAREVGQEYNLPPAVVAQMSQLGVQRETMSDGSRIPTHSRFMMLVEEDNKRSVYVLKNELHPFEYILYSSSAADNAIIDYYMEETGEFDDLEEVLWLIARKGHYGNLELAQYLSNVGQKNVARSIRKAAKKQAIESEIKAKETKQVETESSGTN